MTWTNVRRYVRSLGKAFKNDIFSEPFQWFWQLFKHRFNVKLFKTSIFRWLSKSPSIRNGHERTAPYRRRHQKQLPCHHDEDDFYHPYKWWWHVMTWGWFWVCHNMWLMVWELVCATTTLKRDEWLRWRAYSWDFLRWVEATIERYGKLLTI